jgi:hypothetical protein
LQARVPRDSVPAATLTLLITVPLSLGVAWLGIFGLGDYGWGLFVGLPFAIGFFGTLLFGMHGNRSRGQCVMVSAVAMALVCGFLLSVGHEGAVCLLMAAPVLFVSALVGTLLAYTVVSAGSSSSYRPRRHLLSAVVWMPAFLGVEALHEPAPPVFRVDTAIEIDAPPEAVWRHVIAFPPLPEPTEWWFRVGIAFPVHATIEGQGVGAIRRCEFSTGAFIEPIEVWDPPRLLRFAVTHSPHPMQEWSPHGHVDAPHLEGYFVAKHGQFLLEPLPGGRTRLVGSTWYSHGLWPSWYWRLWSDPMVHAIHQRVLAHVAALAADRG